MSKTPKKAKKSELPKRATALERDVRQLRNQFGEVLKLQATNATLAAMNRRLLGDIEVYQRNVKALQIHIEDLKRMMRVAA